MVSPDVSPDVSTDAPNVTAGETSSPLIAQHLASAGEMIAAWAKRPRRAVIFDFNGTLSDDEPILFAIFEQIFAQQLGWTMTREIYQRDLLGHSDREITEYAVRAAERYDPGLVDMLLDLRRDRYVEAVRESSPVTDATQQLVRRLAVGGVPMAIVTGAQRPDVEAVLSGCPIGTLISTVVPDEDVVYGKPHPEGFLKGAHLLKVDPADVLVFEDSVPGVRAAAAAGMACIAVTGEAPDPAVLAVAPAAVTALGPELLAGTDL